MTRLEWPLSERIKMAKKYKIKPTRKQLKVMRECWAQLKLDETAYYDTVRSNEVWMEKETGIKGIEFVRDEMMGGEWVGVGNGDRTMRLVQNKELEG